jgi:hypothetical protein
MRWRVETRWDFTVLLRSIACRSCRVSLWIRLLGITESAMGFYPWTLVSREYLSRITFGEILREKHSLCRVHQSVTSINGPPKKVHVRSWNYPPLPLYTLICREQDPRVPECYYHNHNLENPKLKRKSTISRRPSPRTPSMHEALGEWQDDVPQ